MSGLRENLGYSVEQPHSFAGQFVSLAEEAARKKQSHLSYLEALLEAEIEARDHRAVIRRIKEAHFPVVKTLEEFDFTAAPHIPVALIKKLSEGEYLERSDPVVLIGETGTGKSHMDDLRFFPTYRKRFDVIAQRAKNEEWWS